MSDLISEFGSIYPVRFAKATAYNSSGEEILCKCGKPSACLMMSKDGCENWCVDCTPFRKEDVELIYSPPKEGCVYNGDPNIFREILDDTWVIGPTVKTSPCPGED